MDDVLSTSEIVVVDDNENNLRLLQNVLAARGYTVHAADNGPDALAMMQTQIPDLVLLDVDMPHMDGYEVCAVMKRSPSLQDVPVMFISAMDQVEDKVKAFQVGGVDYVTKPFRYEEVLARVNTQLTLYHQRRELERLREQDRQTFEALNHIKDEFVLKATHDLKSPLGAITSALALLQEQDIIDDAEMRHEYLKMMQSSISGMLNLVTNLVDLMRIETGHNVEMEAVSVQSVLDDAAERAVVAAGKTDLTVTLPEHDIMVRVDRDRIHLALHHLLTNALNLHPDTVELTATLQDGEVVFSVTDDGPGVPDADLPHVFERFYRVSANEDLPGTGLGLAIVKAVAELHGGRVCAFSTVRRGSKFTINIPIDY